MGRLIDGDALIAWIKGSQQMTSKMKSIICYINTMPTIDAVSVVRCKECKNREKYPCDEIEFYECSHLRVHGTKVGVKDDWFCADGERKESE